MRGCVPGNASGWKRNVGLMLRHRHRRKPMLTRRLLPLLRERQRTPRRWRSMPPPLQKRLQRLCLRPHPSQRLAFRLHSSPSGLARPTAACPRHMHTAAPPCKPSTPAALFICHVSPLGLQALRRRPSTSEDRAGVLAPHTSPQSRFHRPPPPLPVMLPLRRTMSHTANAQCAS